MRTTISRGIGNSVRSRPLPSQGSSNCSDSCLGQGADVGDPRRLSRGVGGFGDCASISSPPVGLIWIVTSRETSPRQSCEAPATRMAPPAVRQARKVMIAMTMTSARPAIELAGTSGMSRLSALSDWMSGAGAGSLRIVGRAHCEFAIEDLQPPVADDEPTRLAELIHQAEIVRRDDDRRAGLVEFDEQAQQPARKARIDIAGRLVRQQQLRPHDQRARDRRALLFAARQHGGQRVHPLAEADPAQSSTTSAR